jgi:flagellar biosynthetic protein FliR
MLDLAHLPVGNWGSYLSALFLLSLRLGAVLLMTPVLHAAQLPTSVRLLVVLGLSLTLSAGLSLNTSHLSTEPGALITAALTELALGSTLGLGIHVAFATFALAGRVLDIQIGFGMAQVLDPVTQRQVPVLNSAFMQIGVLMFFLLDGHHALLRGIALSLETFPLGAGWSIAGTADAVFGQMTGLFALGFALAAPVIFCVLLVEVALGVVARNLPQMNIFMLALPIKIGVALVALALWVPSMGAIMTRVYASIADNWSRIMLNAGSPPPLERAQ